MSVFIGVLLGAGPKISNKNSRVALLDLIETVISSGANTPLDIESDTSLIAYCENLTRILEDSKYTNAGYGSELTDTGTVECDAQMITSVGNSPRQVQASAGAVPMVRNPIKLCSYLICNQLQQYDPALNISYNPLGVPNFIVGEGALLLAKEIGVPYGSLTTDRALASRKKYMAILNKVDGDISVSEQPEIDRFTDTIGIIVITEKSICVCSSSGGPVLKKSGRVGPAAIVGAGAAINADCSVAAVCSGFGEDITALGLASRAAQSQSLNELNIVTGISQPAEKKLKNGEESMKSLTDRLRQRSSLGVLRAERIDSNKVNVEHANSTENMIWGCGRVWIQNHKYTHHAYINKKPQNGGIVV